MSLKGTGNKRQSVKATDHGSKDSEDGEARDSERDKSSNEVGVGISKENEDLADEAELDLLAESISKLHSVGEAFGKEVQKLKEIVNDTRESTVEKTEISPLWLTKHVKTLKQDVDSSERKLLEAKAVIEAKELDIENLLKDKLEEEIQYLTISKALEKLKNDVLYQIAISNELEITLNVVRDTQGHVNLSETRIEDTVETEQVEKLHKRVRQITLRLFLQLILLVLVFVSFVFHSSTQDTGDVPT